MDFLNLVIYGEKLQNWLIGLGIFLATFLILRLAKSLLTSTF